MTAFRYRAITSGKQLVEGNKESPSKAELIQELKRSGHIVLEVQDIGWHKRRLSVQRLSKRDLLYFTQELAALLEGGIPLDKSLQIISRSQKSSVLRDTSQGILRGIKEGKSLAASLSHYPKIFPEVYVNMVKAGEEGSVLSQVLQRLAAFQERTIKVQEEIFSAMLYPILLAVTGALSITVIILYLIPRFSEIFTDMGVALPFSLHFLLFLNHFVKFYGWLVPVVIVAIYLINRRRFKNKATNIKTARKRLKIPLIGKLLWDIEVARFTRTLGTLLENGVPLLKSLDIGKGVLSNAYLASVVESAKADVKKGTSLSASLDNKDFFPGAMTHLIIVGEETGKLGTMLLRVAENLESDAERSIKRLVTLVEPALILFMGLVIGLVVISMLMAIFSLYDMPF
ncbi:MAG TPA: type II secretion system F family protein [Candidatus Tripitaka californicus]|uniref:type II secretion system F family protein n=1 Tax=Candidatus Tripitaka californicus TaxID=3367616 RepID=UPI004024D5D1|nr:type II secretion system F family protein [Planctomycetota bacterium]